MKKLIVLALILFMAGCMTNVKQNKYEEAVKRVPEVRKYVITELEINDQSQIQFINTTQPEMREENSILYYWFKDKTGRAVYTVLTQPGKEFHIFEARKN